MISAPNHALRAACLAALAAMFLADRLAAEVSISIRADSAAELESAERVLSELASEGYDARIEPEGEPSPCETQTVGGVPALHGTRAWIRLSSDPSDGGVVVASICYLGTLPFLQQASTSAPSSEPRRLALATAEALNGLRAKLPPIEATPINGEVRPDPPSTPKAPAPNERLASSFVIGSALVLNLPDFPAAPGLRTQATAATSSNTGLVFDALLPTTGTELTSPEVTATVRTAWLRVGPRLGGAAGDFDLSGALLAGPAITWATAVARAPRLGTSDVATGAVLSLAAFAEYPRRGPIFACGALSASLLLPGARVKLGDAPSSPRGSFPLEVTIGIGARWGQGR